MEKFLYLFRGGNRAQQSPEQMQESMKKWGAWMQKLAKEGKLNGGEPLEHEGTLVKGKSAVVTDGPYAEGKEIVSGYLLVNANSLEEAVEMSKECPILEREGSVEVRQIIPLNRE
jgi:hypothetical protein